MTSKELKFKYTEQKRKEKRIALLGKMKKIVQEMNKLNNCFDLNEILMNDPKFHDDFYNEIDKVLDNLKY